MTEPTIEKRLQKKFIVMSQDREMLSQFQQHAGQEWEMVVVTDLDDIGESGQWNEILLHRFLLLDLDEIEAFDPLDVIHLLRRQYMLNIPVFCFGGDDDLIDEMRSARADRFFTREEMVEMLPEFMNQYRW